VPDRRLGVEPGLRAPLRGLCERHNVFRYAGGTIAQNFSALLNLIPDSSVAQRFRVAFEPGISWSRFIGEQGIFLASEMNWLMLRPFTKPGLVRFHYFSGMDPLSGSPNHYPQRYAQRSMQTGQNSIASENSFPRLGQVRSESGVMGLFHCVGQNIHATLFIQPVELVAPGIPWFREPWQSNTTGPSPSSAKCIRIPFVSIKRSLSFCI
jgi:hypothetical protein